MIYGSPMFMFRGTTEVTRYKEVQDIQAFAVLAGSTKLKIPVRDNGCQHTGYQLSLLNWASGSECAHIKMGISHVL